MPEHAGSFNSGWCSLHDCNQSECFSQHYPEALNSPRTLTPEQEREAIAQTHLAKQAETEKELEKIRDTPEYQKKIAKAKEQIERSKGPS